MECSVRVDSQNKIVCQLIVIFRKIVYGYCHRGQKKKKMVLLGYIYLFGTFWK